MKFVHLSDLHLGKRLGEVSLLEDQKHILDQILTILDGEEPDAVVVAGDVYDKIVPSAEAVALLDHFLVELTNRKLPVLIISGNHDSPERLAFAEQLMARSQVHISPVYDGTVKRVTFTDEHGPVNFFLLPFLKPVHVRRRFPEEPVESYTDAIQCALSQLELDPAARNVLVTHQFVTGGERCDSEELSVGGSDNVDLSVFAPFDYVALGHLHGPQNVDGDRVRYSGTPLKYSFSEVKHRKSVTVVELGAKGERTVRQVPLTPRREMIELRGTHSEVTSPGFYAIVDREAYVRVILTDEKDVPDAAGKLRVVYPNLMYVEYDNRGTRGGGAAVSRANVDRSPLELFADFYEQQNNSPLSQEQRDYLTEVIGSIWEEQS